MAAGLFPAFHEVLPANRRRASATRPVNVTRCAAPARQPRPHPGSPARRAFKAVRTCGSERRPFTLLKGRVLCAAAKVHRCRGEGFHARRLQSLFKPRPSSWPDQTLPFKGRVWVGMGFRSCVGKQPDRSTHPAQRETSCGAERAGCRMSRLRAARSESVRAPCRRTCACTAGRTGGPSRRTTRCRSTDTRLRSDRAAASCRTGSSPPATAARAR